MRRPKPWIETFQASRISSRFPGTRSEPPCVSFCLNMSRASGGWLSLGVASATHNAAATTGRLNSYQKVLAWLPVAPTPAVQILDHKTSVGRAVVVHYRLGEFEDELGPGIY